MRNLKRFLAMALTVLMVMGCFSVMAVSADFDDVVDYQDQINLLTTLGIIAGKDDGTFGYGEDVERYQMALFVARMNTGKVNDDYVNWYETENYTGFNDVKADHFLGSISYAADNGIVKGYIDAMGNIDKFGPTDGITIQDVFTMAVRMLGYGSASMDANYPWSYVHKAIELGLDDDLPPSYNNEDVATREETVVILYNALFAPRADGKTIALANFNLQQATFVITGGVFAGTDVTKAGYVLANKLGTTGVIETTPTYNLSIAELGIENVNAKLGYSYDVISRDNFATILYAAENTSKKVDQTAFPTSYASTSSGKIDGETYKLVSNYSSVYNLYVNGKRASVSNEIILSRFCGNHVQGWGKKPAATTANASYVYDKNYNILDEYGNVLLWWVPHSVSGKTVGDEKYPNFGIDSTNGSYLFKIANGTYIEPDASIWAQAATVDSNNTANWVITDFRDIGMYNAYADATLFDDDNDGIWDRGIYVNYAFGFITKDGDGHMAIKDHNTGPIVHDSGKKIADLIYIDAAGNKLTVEDVYTSVDPALGYGNYVLYSYCPLINTVIIKKIFEPTLGLVTTVNQNNIVSGDKWTYAQNATIVFDQVYYNLYAGNVSGTTFNIGNAFLPGGRYINVIAYTDFSKLVGKTVKAITDNGAVLAVYEAENNGRYVVYDSAVGVSSTGYLQALVYDYSTSRTALTIASVNGVWYTQNMYASSYNQPYASGLNWGRYELLKGDLLYVETDALGISHVTIVPTTDGYNGIFSYNSLEDNVDKNAYEKGVGDLGYGTYIDTPGYLLNKDLGYTFWTMVEEADVDPYIYFINGIVGTTYNDNGVWFTYENGVAKNAGFKKFKTDANTIIVVETPVTGDPVAPPPFGGPDYTLKAYAGVPQNGAYIELMDWLNGRCQIFVQTDSNGFADLIYVKDGKFADNLMDLPPELLVPYPWLENNQNSTIIFVDKDCKASQQQTNQVYTGLSVTLGATYKYDYAIDFIRGGFVTVYTGVAYNYPLQAGRFYRVVDGYVTEMIPVNDDSDVRVGALEYIDEYQAIVLDNNVVVFSENYASNVLYKLDPLNGYDVAHKSSYAGSDLFVPINYIGTAENDKINAMDSYATVYFYAGDEFGWTGTNVYIFSEANAGDIAPENTWYTSEITVPTYVTKPGTTFETLTFTVADGRPGYFQLTEDCYTKLSTWGSTDSDNINNINYNILNDNLVRFYDKDNNLVAGVNASTFAMVKNRLNGSSVGNPLYFLQLDSVDVEYMVWTNIFSPVSYRIELNRGTAD
jgi:hypothetical protein